MVYTSLIHLSQLFDGDFYCHIGKSLDFFFVYFDNNKNNNNIPQNYGFQCEQCKQWRLINIRVIVSLSMCKLYYVTNEI